MCVTRAIAPLGIINAKAASTSGGDFFGLGQSWHHSLGHSLKVEFNPHPKTGLAREKSLRGTEWCNGSHCAQRRLIECLEAA
jgi:hypothetical protein